MAISHLLKVWFPKEKESNVGLIWLRFWEKHFFKEESEAEAKVEVENYFTFGCNYRNFFFFLETEVVKLFGYNKYKSIFSL